MPVPRLALFLAEKERVVTYLNEILSLWFRNQWLQLGGGERVDETGLGHDQQQHLGAGQHGQFVCLASLKALLALSSLWRRERSKDIQGKWCQDARGRGHDATVPSS